MTTEEKKTFKFRSLKRLGKIQYIAIFILIICVYAIAGKLSLALASINKSTSPFWPASGIALSSLVIFGWRFAPAIFLGALITNLNTGTSLVAILGISIGNMSEALVGAYLLEHLLEREAFKTYKEPLTFLLGGALASLVSALIGASVLYLSGVIPSTMMTYTILTWWGGDFVGIMVFGPFLLALTAKGELSFLRSPLQVLELFFYAGLIFLVSYQVFLQNWYEGSYWILAGIFLVATYRLNTLAARFLLLVSSLIAIDYTLKGFGPFEYGSANLNLLYLQLVVITFAAAVLFFNAFRIESSDRTVFFILLIGILFVGTTVNWLSLDEKTFKQSQFESLVGKVKSNLQQAENQYSMLLRSGGGLISLFPNIRAADWRAFAANLTLKENYSAVNGLGTVRYLQRSEIPDYLTKIKKLGIPDFNVRNLDIPYQEKFDSDYLITYIEPIENNGPARGLNLGSERNRREAADHSKAISSVVATKPIQLVQDKIKRPGFLIYFPIWVDDSKVSETESNPKSKTFWGWAYAPVISETFFSTALKELAAELNIELQIESEKVFQQGLILAKHFSQSLFRIDEDIKLFNVTHHLQIYPREAFFNNRKNFPVLVGATLTILLILLAAVISGLGSFASILAKQVQQRTDELDKERMKSLQNSKLASLGEMSAGIAHEINNPLAIISGSIGLIPHFLNNPEKLQSKIEAIQKSCDRIAKIVGSLKKFARSSETVEFEKFSLETLINESISLIEHKAKRFTTRLQVELKTNTTIKCNDVEIEQVLVNLMSNAIDAVKNLPVRWVKVIAKEDDDFIILQVIDSGSGIPKAIRDKIFDPFYTTKTVGEGTGLGLSVSKGILDEHKATITVLPDTPNTCFEIRFRKDNRG